MRIAILGGTVFVGRHIAEAALARGHTLTLFHRGLSGPNVFPEVEHVLGDRDAGLDQLRGRAFDVVVDTCGYELPSVRAALVALSHPGLHYVFISSGSVYADLSKTDESGPVQTIEDAETALLSIAN